ncbi:MAG TPA: class I SAM-dependent methyltransferase, partial [bacterium]|nr:class I SAM-dependent methyltransferase [bacterium]
MKVYNHLAEVYDYFINWDERIKREDPFFQHLFRERLGTAILDLGCATGGHALHWSEMGYNVVGLDSAADMIEQARRLGEERELDIEFL